MRQLEKAREIEAIKLLIRSSSKPNCAENPVTEECRADSRRAVCSSQKVGLKRRSGQFDVSRVAWRNGL